MNMSPTWIGARAAGLTPILVDRGNRPLHADCLRGQSLLDLTPPPANIWHDKPDDPSDKVPTRQAVWHRRPR
jgi:hypothetical protein